MKTNYYFSLTALIFALLLLLNNNKCAAQDFASNNSRTKNTLYAMSNDDEADAFIAEMNKAKKETAASAVLANNNTNSFNAGKKVNTGLGYCPTWDATQDNKTMDAPIITVLEKAVIITQSRVVPRKKISSNLITLQCDVKLAQQ